MLPFTILLFTSAAISKTLTVYEVLEDYDFPVGLIPTGVTSYTMDTETGEFQVNLGYTCKLSIEGHDLKYKSTISGVISRDKLTKLKGVSIKLVLFWMDIVEVTRDGDELDFSVGTILARFNIDNFEESPACKGGWVCLRHGFSMGDVATRTMPHPLLEYDDEPDDQAEWYWSPTRVSKGSPPMASLLFKKIN
ncbi:hypothetical protein L1987_76477 [Smallanthus sonchifolius]|uniref:Uncharacterized protein n=1 Tax=Smallanthus sonchifolius TaxID=185202 RepID=A0ACB8Z7J9_9ASTR|nr:hypothetical protein L1987_76477 [Smallanthus sonchifolius]